MIKLYLMLIVLGILGSVGYGAVWYYNDTQQRIATLRENNAKLEVAVQTSEASIETLQNGIEKAAELNKQLQSDLQKAEAYGDELRGKLSRMNLIQDALKDAKALEGKMNGATAKLWRGLMEDTGGSGDAPLPSWLQRVPDAGAESTSSDKGGENNGTTSSETEASPAQ